MKYLKPFPAVAAVILLLLVSQGDAGPPTGRQSSLRHGKAAETASTAYFEFSNNYWINLHHFLYQRAKGSQLRKLREGHRSFLSVGEEGGYQGLSDAETKSLDRAVAYYKKNLIEKDLRRDLGDMRLWLQEQDESKPISDTKFTPEFTEILNTADATYRAKFWPLHKAQNEHVLELHLNAVREVEAEVIGEMERLARYKWPAQQKVRVDLTAYANYAGAYTPTQPQLNIIISTLDPLSNTSSFIETVFHEGSHLLYNLDDSPFRRKFYDMSEQKGIRFPRELWHASLFYLCGRVVQDALKKKEIEHKLEMDERNIFSEFNTPGFRDALEKYYRKELDLNKTVDALLTGLGK